MYLNDKQKALITKLITSMREYTFTSPTNEQLTKPMTWVIQGNGIWEITKNKIGIFKYQIEDLEFPGLPNKVIPEFQFLLPKIPAKIFLQIISFFRDIYDKYNGAEAHIYIYYDHVKNRYFSICMDQEVSGASAKVKVPEKISIALDENPRFSLVLDLHSHAMMGAFFSGQDDRDDQSLRLHGTLGKIKDIPPAFVLRAGLVNKYGKGTEIEPELLIESYKELDYTYTRYPACWMNRVNKYTIQTIEHLRHFKKERINQDRWDRCRYKEDFTPYHYDFSYQTDLDYENWVQHESPRLNKGKQLDFFEDESSWEYKFSKDDIAKLFWLEPTDIPIDEVEIFTIADEIISSMPEEKLVLFLAAVQANYLDFFPDLIEKAKEMRKIIDSIENLNFMDNLE